MMLFIGGGIGGHGGIAPTKQESTAVAIVFKAKQSFRICYLPTISISTHLEANSS